MGLRFLDAVYERTVEQKQSPEKDPTETKWHREV